jgi:hypothetical protein
MSQGNTTCRGCGKDAGPSYVSHPMTDLDGTDGTNWGDTAMVLCDHCEENSRHFKAVADFINWRNRTRPQRDDGGPAFPRPSTINDGMIETHDQTGMSLRDHFAGLALTGILSADASADGVASLTPAPKAAKRAYEYADAMLAARKS